MNPHDPLSPDDEAAARRLIGEAMADAMNDAATVESIGDIVEMVASELRNEADLLATLQSGRAAVFALTLHKLGDSPTDPDKQAGVVGLRILAIVDTPAPTDLLNHLSTDDNTGLGLLSHATSGDDTALMMITATPRGDLIAAVAQLSGDRTVGAFPLSDDELLTRLENGNGREMAAAYRALSQAAKRRAQ